MAQIFFKLIRELESYFNNIRDRNSRRNEFFQFLLLWKLRTEEGIKNTIVFNYN